MSTVKDLYKTLFETQENKLKTGIIGMIIITSMLAGVFYYEANAIEVADLNDLQDMVDIGGKKRNLVEYIVSDTENGDTDEYQHNDVGLEITEEQSKLMWVNCTLTWQDEDSEYFLGTNEPDEFQVSIIAPNDEFESSGFSTGGEVSASFHLDYEEDDFEENYISSWTLRVEAGECGDDSALAGRIIRTTADDGNNWNLRFSYTYLDYEEEAENTE